MRARFYLLFGKIHIQIEVGRFKMFFRVSGDPDAKIRPLAIFDIVIQIAAVVHVRDLFHEVECIVVSSFFGNELPLKLACIAPNGQHVFDVQEVEVNERIFGVLF